MTPELAVGTPVGRSKLFPVFRRRGDYKVSNLDARVCEAAMQASSGAGKSWWTFGTVQADRCHDWVNASLAESGVLAVLRGLPWYAKMA